MSSSATSSPFLLPRGASDGEILPIVRSTSGGGLSRPTSVRALPTDGSAMGSIVNAASRMPLMGGLATRGVTAQFYCQICMSMHPKSEATYLSGCGHPFCKPCIVSYIDSKVAQGRVYINCVFDKNDRTGRDAVDPAEEEREGILASIRRVAPLSPSRRSLAVAAASGFGSVAGASAASSVSTSETASSAVGSAKVSTTSSSSSSSAAAAADGVATVSSAISNENGLNVVVNMVASNSASNSTSNSASSCAGSRDSLTLDSASASGSSGALDSTVGGSASASSANTATATALCNQTIRDSDIRKALEDAPNGEKALERYQRFKKVADDPNTRECPKCNFSQSGKESEPTMLCEQCGTTYCFLHSGAHAGRTCIDYEKETLQERKLNEAAASKFARPCPNEGCGIYISKASGCNHMQCPKCKTNFCWICNKVIEGGTLPTHYATWNISGCGGMQFAEEGSAQPSYCVRLCKLICLALIYIPFLPVSAVLSIASCILCAPCAWGCYKAVNEDEDVETVNPCYRFVCACVNYWNVCLVLTVLLGGIALPIAVTVAALAFVVGIICAPCFFAAIYKRRART